jgi:hypothetical protein
MILGLFAACGDEATPVEAPPEAVAEPVEAGAPAQEQPSVRAATARIEAEFDPDVVACVVSRPAVRGTLRLAPDGALAFEPDERTAGDDADCIARAIAGRRAEPGPAEEIVLWLWPLSGEPGRRFGGDASGAVPVRFVADVPLRVASAGQRAEVPAGENELALRPGLHDVFAGDAWTVLEIQGPGAFTWREGRWEPSAP